MYGYFFLRSPFGLNCLNDIFQCKIDNLFHDLKRASGIVDNMILWGYVVNGSDHNKYAEIYYNNVTKRISNSTQESVP